MNKAINYFTSILAAGAFCGISYAQQPPSPPANGAPPLPPPPARAVAGEGLLSRQGTIKSFNTGPNGETNGVVLRDGTVVNVPPELGARLRSSVREGSRIAVAGPGRPGVSGQTVMDAQTITYKGQTMTVPPAPPRPAGPGRLAGGPPPPPNPNAPPPPPPPPPQQGPRGNRREPAPPPPPPAEAGVNSPGDAAAPVPPNTPPPPARF